MKFCNYCNAALEVGEDLFCSSCLLDGRQLKKVRVKDWKINIKEKLDIVKKTIDSVEIDIDTLKEECE
mgnify:FL=1|tara:strand:- start:3207 stop:3410 length:204 start_codon:yes stop_codon:yes gene_type:complete